MFFPPFLFRNFELERSYFEMCHAFCPIHFFKWLQKEKPKLISKMQQVFVGETFLWKKKKYSRCKAKLRILNLIWLQSAYSSKEPNSDEQN